MATFPSSDASSPTPTKVTSASATVVSSSFTPPVRSCLVVSVTSDADAATGAAPTISHTGGEPITWTRVGPALGFSSTGDVGIVAVFQGVFTDLASPPGSRAAMTVTVNNLPTASKPKLLVPRVYTEDQVDITDPIGATAGGSFATGTLITGSVTPETSEGGVRFVQLDWSATGVPTTFLPNNDNAELVDSFHNAGLSTNLALGGKRRTRAGVAETMGARLLASATDGNWLIYELRGPQPAAGSAVDSTAFDTGAFDTGGGASTPSGTGSGSWSFNGAGTGKRVPKATGAGTLTFAGSGVGDAPSPPPAQASGSGSWGFTGAGTGKRTPKSAGAGTVTFTGAGTGRRVARATGGGTLTWTATGTGKRTPKAVGSGAWSFTGTGTGRRSPKGGGTGSWTFVGTGLGNTPGVGMSEAVGSGSWGFVGSGVGKRQPKATSTGTLLWSGTGAGKRRPVATGSGLWSLSTAAIGYRHPVASGAGSLAWTGMGVGQQPGAPTDFEGRIIAAVLSTPTAAGSLATSAVAARLTTPAARGQLTTAEAGAHLSTLTATGVIT